MRIQLNKAMDFKKEVQKNIYLFSAAALILVLAGIAAYAPHLTGLYTATAIESNEDTLKLSLPLEFDKEYTDVRSIHFEGTPGGIWCQAGITIEAYDGSGTKVGEWTAPRTDDHDKTWKDVNLDQHINIKKIVGKPSGNFPSCVFIDYLSATLTYNVPEEGYTTGLEGTQEVSNESSQTYSGTMALDFSKEYSNVKRITIKGRPGGGWCEAKIKAEAFDMNNNKVATIITDPVDAQDEVTKYMDFIGNPIKVKKVKGETYGTGKCSYLDYMKATLNYVGEPEPVTVPETVTAATPDVTKPQITSLTFTPASPTTADDVVFSATATDDTGVTKIEIYVGGALAKTCTDIGSCSTDKKNYPNTHSSYFYAKAYDATGNSIETATKRFDVISVPTYALSVTISGGGSGRVNSAPTDINCTWVCSSKRFEVGKQVTVTATPDLGSKFSGWGGDCSGTNPSCSLTMNAGKTLKVTFEKIPTPQVTFTASKDPANSARITFTPVVSSAGSEIKEYKWEYGDGNIDTIQIYSSTQTTARSHTYSNSGTYNVKLTIKDSLGITNSATNNVAVSIQPSSASDTTPPTVILTVPRTTAEVGDEIYISATANDNAALKSVKLCAPGSSQGNSGGEPCGMVKECSSSNSNTKQLTCSYSVYYSSPGTYTISAETKDMPSYNPYRAEMTGTANPIQVTIAPDTKPPYIQSTLTKGETMKKGVTYYSVDATATDGTCVAKIEIGSKEKLVKSCDFSSSCGRVESCSTGFFNPANFGRIIYVKAYDPFGHVATGEVKDKGEFENLLDETNANSNPPPSEDAKKEFLRR